MPSTESIKRVHDGWMKFPAKDYFVNVDEGHDRLGFESKQEFEFEMDRYEQRKLELKEERVSRKKAREDMRLLQTHRPNDENDNDNDLDREERRLRTASDSQVRRQLLALTRLCEKEGNPVGRRFWPVLLNQEPTKLENFDPTDCLSLDDEQVRQAMKTIQHSFDWSHEQSQALEVARRLSGRLGLLQGPPGSAKTQILVGMTAFCLLAGLDVILFTPSASSAEKLADTLKSFLKTLRRPSNGRLLDIDPIGLYRTSPDYQRLGGRRYGPSNINDTDVNLSDAQLVITTIDNRWTNKLLNEFGRYSKGITVLHDDCNQEVESNTWTTIFGFEERVKVQGIFLAGDASEWLTDMHSRSSHLNAFRLQMSMSLFDRLNHRGFPTVILKQQYRMRPQLSRLPILRQYKDLLINAPETRSRESNSQFADFLCSWLTIGGNDITGDLAVSIVDVWNGHEKKENGSSSKLNYENVNVVMYFCLQNYKQRAINPGDIAILSRRAL
jgi:hypothetical protein